ncbi:ATPase, T2SS/T4P/T4SS family [Meiothermus granaticius]|uniref:Putative type II secretion system protein HxcR n=1 Tax=Meiothermus granaticius NBRC 107808 TaxID=1227551 RepID=A0A399F689_9DEIN|nr:ATPase, T2SS/T4P/T4SS family [Meiothermus granaticius]RIH91748.1 putative type II secretion system protein HxcR [Meiothermus granaticius NBRC 107808]GEM88128.1 pilus assembly protein PilF [Meiothermus granaticius NBRC 107808]
MANALTIGDKRLGAALLDMGLLGDEELQRALEQHREVGGNLGDIVVELGMLSERRIAQAIEETFGVPLVELVGLEIAPEAKALVPAERARDLGAIPFSLEGGSLRVALLNPLDNLVLEELEDLTGQIIEPYQTTRSSFQYALALHYPELGLPVPPPPSTASPGEMQLGEILISQGLVRHEDLEAALVEQEKTGELLGRILINKFGLTEESILRALAQQAGLEFRASAEDLEYQPEVSALLLRPDALRYQAVPVRQEGNQVLVLLADPRHRKAVAQLIDRPTQFILTTPKVWEEFFGKVYPEKSRLGEALVQEGKLGRAALQDALSVQRRMGKTRPLGEVLVELGYVTAEDVEDALSRQRQGGGRLEDTLVQSGKIKPEMLAKSLATQLGYPYIDPNDSPIDPSVLMLVPEATVRRYTVIPHHLEGNTLVVLMKDPRNILAVDDVKMITKREVMPAVAAESQIVKLIERFYGSQSGVEELAREFENKRKEETQVDTSALDDNAVVKLVNSIIREAFLQEASDIHIEPRQNDILVRTRIDGNLREYMRLPKGAGPAVASRVKIMANLDIAERRLPQDGRVRYRDRAIDLDLRLSTLPTVYGEKIVMRLLRKAADIPEIEQLGFAPDVFQRFEDVIAKPYGIFLITGPTGSGKSFTTFSILKRIATPDKNTTTVEDPVEYEIPGINQTQVNPQAGLTFARALRSFLRQDPDIIMVGEIRDSETAKIATEAALTGHLVIATLHTNDAAGAVTRLDEMGVELFNISAALVGVLAQRLVRRICESCKIQVEADPNVLRRLGMSKDEVRGKALFKGTGCDKCNGSGYRGRAAIHELMVLDDEIRRAIVEGQSATQIKEISRKGGMKTLREDGIQKAFQGLTTLEEVMARTSE